ncbi:hypothetical protein [Streptomyces sp. NPDC059761]|uniref:hypothetical protein n=1 Tax=Streptomyces sp. NPDC059761 TaxID=3346937 RepID=UPI00365888E3
MTATLITVAGLARRFGVAPTHIRNLMQHRDCPVREVEIEGADRAAIYPLAPAVAYLAKRIRRTG